MKSFLIVVCSLACAFAASVDSDATVVKSVSSQSPDGSFNYGFETDNGIFVNTDGKVKYLNKDEVALEITGSSGYVAPDGENIQLTFIANENGFQAEGSHLPKAPEPEPYPDHVVRLLKYLEEHPYKPEAERV